MHFSAFPSLHSSAGVHTNFIRLSSRVEQSVPLTQPVARTVFRAACIVGRPLEGIRPRRVYGILARAGFKRPDPKWLTISLGFRVNLCPFFSSIARFSHVVRMAPRFTPPWNAL
jgi:hypothetical protein